MGFTIKMIYIRWFVGITILFSTLGWSIDIEEPKTITIKNQTYNIVKNPGCNTHAANPARDGWWFFCFFFISIDRSIDR